MRYPYVPMPQRKPLKFPNGKRVAVIVTFNLETWDLKKESNKPYYAGGPAVLPIPLPGNIPDYHNYEQGELLTDYAFDIDKEKTVIARTLEAYEAYMGKKAKGWLSSSLRSTENTARILVENGCSFFCDIMNDDQPLMINTDSGPIVGIPYTNEINDFTLVTRRGHSTDEVSAIYREELEVLYEESAHSMRIMNIGLHPHVSGRAYRNRALKEFLKYATSLEDIWWATREEIASWYAQNHQNHFEDQLEN